MLILGSHRSGHIPPSFEKYRPMKNPKTPPTNPPIIPEIISNPNLFCPDIIIPDVLIYLLLNVFALFTSPNLVISTTLSDKNHLVSTIWTLFNTNFNALKIQINRFYHFTFHLEALLYLFQKLPWGDNLHILPLCCPSCQLQMSLVSHESRRNPA